MLNIFIFSSGRLLCTHYYRMHIVSLGRGYCKKVTQLSLSVNILLYNRSDLLIKYLNSGYTSNLIIYNMLAGITYSSGQQIWKVVLPHLSVRVSEVLCFIRSIFFTSVLEIWLWNTFQILECSSLFCSCSCCFWNSTCVSCTRQCFLNPMDSGKFNGWNMMSIETR